MHIKTPSHKGFNLGDLVSLRESFTRVTRSPAAGRFGGLQTIQEWFFFARAGRQSRPARAKKGDLRGRLATPKPPPLRSGPLLLATDRQRGAALQQAQDGIGPEGQQR